MLSALGKRVFLLNNVHENAPVTFQTRWTLSYLRGPMTREQIKTLTAAAAPAEAAPGAAAALPAAAPDAVHDSRPPILPPGIEAHYLPVSGSTAGIEYYPAVCGALTLHYAQAKYQVDLARRASFAAPLTEGPVALDWDQAIEIPLAPREFLKAPAAGAVFAELPAEAKKVNSYDGWRKDLLQRVRRNQALQLMSSERFRLVSRPEESPSEFVARVSQAAREQRDLEVEKLRRRYAGKFATLQDRLMRAEQAMMREKEQLSAKKVETAISFGTAILGAFLGRKAVSATSAGRLGTAMKSAGRLRKESMDTARAQETAESVKAKIAELEAELETDIAKLEAAFDPAGVSLKEIRIPPAPAGIAQEFFGLLWLPYRRDNHGKALPAWRTASP